MSQKKTVMMWKGIRFSFLLAVIITLLGCANAKPIEGPVTADRVPDGPGLFTGEKGEYRIRLFGDTSGDDERGADRASYSSGSSRSPASQSSGHDEGQL